MMMAIKQCIIFVCLVALSTALPSNDYGHPKVHIPILKDDRVDPDASGKYAFEFETGNGISRSEAGTPLHNAYGSVGQEGAVSFTFPSGEPFYLSFVADENGFQPKSPWIPVAPKFPHPIPQFVLDQIEKARIEDANGHGYGDSAHY